MVDALIAGKLDVGFGVTVAEAALVEAKSEGELVVLGYTLASSARASNFLLVQQDSPIKYPKESVAKRISIPEFRFGSEMKPDDVDSLMDLLAREEDYLRAGHALFGMFQGSIVWYNPRFPIGSSLHDIHKFQAWWAQGIRENKNITVEIIANEADWKEDLKKLSGEAKEMIREESRRFRTRVTVRLAATSLPEPGFRPVFFFGKTSKLKYVMLLFRVHRSELPGILGYSLLEAKDLSKLEQETLEGDRFDELIRKARSGCDATFTLNEAVEHAPA